MIEAASAADLDEFCRLVNYQRTPNLRGMKLVLAGKICACAGFDSWTPNSVQVHVWGVRFTRQFIREVCKYMFVACKKRLAIGVTPGDNAKALDFNRRIGFRVVHVIPDGWDLGTSMVIQELRINECIWMVNEQISAPSP